MHAAKKAKNDEFYTQFEDINEELKHYKEHFFNKIVFCNCDDPEYSNFYQYFKRKFAFLGLKKLITTHFEETKPSYKLVITEYSENDPPRETLVQNGDFRSPECIEFLKEADIVCTNPPFSLFREFVAQLVQYGKDFIIIGNKNAITYKEIFSLIKANKLWLGHRNINKDMWLILPDDAEEYEKIKVIKNAQGEEQEKKMKHIMACWFTNLDHRKRHEEMILYRKYSPEAYPNYDNYDAINVDKVVDIPCDYDGVMGVPVTFLDVYNPNQFEILELGIIGSCTFTCNKHMEILDKYGKGTGKYTYNAKGTLYKKYNPATDKKPAFRDVETGELYSSIYARVLIRRKK